MARALVNGRVLARGGLLEGHAVLLDGARIGAVLPAREAPRDAERHDLEGGILLPGFIDVQVNGGGGVLFNDAPTLETIRTIGAAHAQYGTTGFLPTLISGDPAMIEAAIGAVDAAIEAGVPGVLGIHIEGPFLNPAKKGIHDDARFRRLDEESFALIARPKRGKTLLTLAPEMTTPETIRALTREGVIVSAGHSDADYETVRAALDHGLAGFTHLFNAMSPLRARAPGTVGAALEAAESWCGVIADGQHVHPATLRIALKCRGADRLMLVTDAMPSVGSAEKSFVLQGRRITVRNGVCVAPDGTLAGSDLDMAAALRNAMAFLSLDLAAASRMASHNPARFLGLAGETGEIAPGHRADLVLLTDALEVVQSWAAGQPLLAA